MEPSSAKSGSRHTSAKKGDVFEIPIGRIGSFLKHTIWMLISAVLVIVLLVVLLQDGSSVSATVSAGEAGQKLLAFVNAQGQGTATLVSAEQEGTLYKITVNYNGQDIPVFVTLDGTYLVAQPVPLDGGTATGAPTAPSGNSNERVSIEIGDAPVLGSASAPVTIVEFSDYECPFCGRHFSQTYPQLKKDYIDTGKVKLAVRDFPLDFHPNAQKAAEAARCFGEQKGDSGYYQMHDTLYQNQNSLSVENYKKWARELGATGATFDSCLDSGKYAEAVKADLAYGQSVGISGTPGFFINGVPLVGAQPYSAFKQIIDAELAAAQ